jgi:hypothetical protein
MASALRHLDLVDWKTGAGRPGDHLHWPAVGHFLESEGQQGVAADRAEWPQVVQPHAVAALEHPGDRPRAQDRVNGAAPGPTE